MAELLKFEKDKSVWDKVETRREAYKTGQSKAPTVTQPTVTSSAATTIKVDDAASIQRKTNVLTERRNVLLDEKNAYDTGTKDLVSNLSRYQDIQNQLKIVDDELKTLEAGQRVNDAASTVRKDTFLGQTAANYDVGRLTQDQSLAWSAYLENPTAANRKRAELLDAALQTYQTTNASALDDENAKATIISKSFANYAPQMLDQTKAQVLGGLGGFAVGGVAGVKVGASIASGLQSYQTMRGSAFKRLIDLGVDEETARALATDEAFINGLIEAGDTYLEWAMFGGKAAGKVAGKLLPGAASAVTSATGKATSAASKTALAKAAKAISANVSKLPQGVKSISAYLLNIPQEGLEEGFQEVVSMSTDKLAQSDAATGNILQRASGLASNIADTGKSVLAGTDIAASEQVLGAAKEGMKIAAVAGGLKMAGGYVVNAAVGTGNKVDTKTQATYNKDNEVSPAAAPVIQQAAEQGEITRAENPKTDVLTAAQTAYIESGVVQKIPKAKRNALIVQKLVAGENVTNEDIDKLALSTPKGREVFTQLTGVQFPANAKLTPELLRNAARSAQTVAQQAQAQQDAVAKVKADFQAQQERVAAENLTPEQLAEKAREVRNVENPAAAEQAAQILAQARGDIAPNGKPLLSYKEFSKFYDEHVTDHKATREEKARLYEQYLKENQTVLFNGKRMSYQQFVQIARMAPDGDKLTDAEIDRLWTEEVKRQSQDGKDASEHSMRNKEAKNNGKREGQGPVHSAGLHGQSDQRSRGERASVSGETGRAESESGARREDRTGRGVQGSAQDLRSEDARMGQPASRELGDGSGGVAQSEPRRLTYSTVGVPVTLPDGTEVLEIPPEQYTPEMREQVEKFEPIGVNVRILLGGYPIPGTDLAADGVSQLGKEVYLQADSVRAVNQLGDHELVHQIVFTDKALAQKAFWAFINDVTDEEFDTLREAFGGLYERAYDGPSTSMLALIEEMVADAYAGIDRFDVGLDKHQGVVRAVVDPWLQSKTETYRAELALTDDAGNLVVESDDQGHSRFSMSTFKDSGREILSKWMTQAVLKGDLTQQDADDILSTVDTIYEICENYKEDYGPFSAWSEAKVVVNEDGDPVFSVVKANGDYAMNLDFSLVCKKRRTLDAVLNELVARGFADNLALDQENIVKINDTIREHGFETACALCFVDAKRFRQGKVADDFVKLYNDLVLSLIPEQSGIEAQYFNFGGDTTVTGVANPLDQAPASQLNFTRVNEVLKTYGPKTVEHKVAKLLKSSAQDRKLTKRGDFLSTRGFDAINRQNPRVLKLFNAKKGSGGPKSAVSDVQYLNEVLKSRSFNAEKAYAVGGVRVQSFSDYVPRMVFDYVQMIADLSAKKMPAHSYTKEELYVKQFGLTGMKINMSLIPRVEEDGVAAGLDADGNYVWADESFDYDEALKIQNAEGYSRNCGTIAVGVSDEHIRAMMADPEIRMVIPYHKSGLNPIVAKLNKISKFTDYTDYQNTRHPDGTKLDPKKAADKKLLAEHPNFNQRLHELGDAGDPRQVVEEYVHWCEENNLLPKFDQFTYKQIDGVFVEQDGKRVVDENYYKLIEDFSVYDGDTYVAQGPLTMTFPTEDSAFGSMADLIKRGLEEDAVLEGKRDAEVGKIVDEIMKFSVSETKYSVIDSNGQLLTEQQQEYFKNSKMRDHMGRLMTMFHGTKSFGFTVFDPKFSDDGRSLFFTDRPSTSRTYTGTKKDDIRALNKDSDVSVYNIDPEDIRTEDDAWTVLNKLGYKKVLPETLNQEQLQGAIDSKAEIALEEAGLWLDAIETDITQVLSGYRLTAFLKGGAMSRLKQTIAALRESIADPEASKPRSLARSVLLGDIEALYAAEQDLIDSLDYFWEQHPNYDGVEYYEGLKDSISDPERANTQLRRLVDAVSFGESAYVVFSPTEGVFHLAEGDLRNEAYQALKQAKKGLYEVYLNLENPLIIDANESNWNALDHGDLTEDGLNDGVYWEGETTREIAEWAQANNFDGVIFKNLYDHGYYAEGDESAATIAIAFRGDQVKSSANYEPTKDPDIRYSIVNPDLSFADQADLVRQNKLNEFLVPGTTDTNPQGLTNSAVYVTKEPNPLMQELGYGDYALVVTQKHLRQMMAQREDENGKVIDEHNHQLTPRQVKRMPKLLEKPAAVIQAKGNRPESLVFVTTERDYANRPIIVSVKANGADVVYDGNIGPAHIVTSMYGRDRFGKFFEDAVNAGQLVYYNKERIDPILTAAGYQSSGLLSGIDSDTILGAVQPKVKNPAERKFSITPEFEKWYLQGFTDDEERTQVQKTLSELRQQHGDIPAGENPVREVYMPRKNQKGERVHDTVQTVMEAAATPENRLGDIQKAVVDGKFADIPIENKTTARRMHEKIKRDGWDKSITNWTAKVRAGEASANLVAEGAVLLNNAGNSDMTGEQYVDLLTDYSDLLHRVGQSLQAARILKTLSPEGKLYGVQKQINKMNDERRAKAEGKPGFDPEEWADKNEIKLDPALVNAYRNAETDEERDAILDQIQQHIADQMPATLWEKLNNWRYLAMLGNFRTQIRNVAGNAMFQIPRVVKETVAGGLEGALANAGVNIDRTRSMARDHATFVAAKEDFKDVRDIILSGSKLDEKTHYENAIDAKRRIYKNRVLEGYRKVVNKAMDEGDAVFCKFTYADALARFMAANHTTWAEASEALKERGRRHAIREAAEATYRDNNAFSKAILKVGYKNPTSGFEKAINAVIEGVLPFRKTPANILARGVEYSPLGLIKTSVDAVRVAKGSDKVTGNDVINDLAKTLTGSGLFMMGYFMAKNGLLAALGPDDDEKEKDFWELQGNQSYAFVWDGKSYTVDWLAPEAIPVLVGANTAEIAAEEGLDLNTATKAVTRITDPMLQMSMLQGVNDLIENIANTQTVAALPSLILNSLWSYGLQYVPALLGQAERAADNTRRSTYKEADSGTPGGVQYALGKLSQKVPGWDYHQIPYIDQWGRMEENYETTLGNTFAQFLSPSYKSVVNTSAMETELQRLYDATGESGVLPATAPKEFTVDGEKRKLTGGEYVNYATIRGQTAHDLLVELTSSAAYRGMSDADKVTAVKDVYSYAGEVAKAEILDTDPSKSAQKVIAAEDYGISAAEYTALDAATSGIVSLKDADGETITNSKGLQIMEVVYEMMPKLTKDQYERLFEDLGVGKTVRGYSKQMVANKLKQMRKQADVQ